MSIGSNNSRLFNFDTNYSKSIEKNDWFTCWYLFRLKILETIFKCTKNPENPIFLNLLSDGKKIYSHLDKKMCSEYLIVYVLMSCVKVFKVTPKQPIVLLNEYISNSKMGPIVNANIMYLSETSGYTGGLPFLAFCTANGEITLLELPSLKFFWNTKLFLEITNYNRLDSMFFSPSGFLHIWTGTGELQSLKINIGAKEYFI
jgi:hypothetical protein